MKNKKQKFIKDPFDVRIGETLEVESALPAVSLLGAPWDGAVGTRPGSRQAPASIRQQLYSMPYTGGYRILDLGDVDAVIGDHQLTWRRITRSVRECLSIGEETLVMGGDSTVSYAAHRALRNRVETGVAYVMLDAHPDVRVVTEGLTSGQVARWVRNMDPATPIFVLGVRPRSNASYLFREADKLNVSVLTLDQMMSAGVSETVSLVAERCEDRVVQLSVNMDVVDPAYAPGVNSPSPGGLTSREALNLVTALCLRMKPRLVDVVEVTPAYDRDGVTSSLAAAMLSESIWVGKQA
ncbi:MAG: arginase family protein [Thermoprotei archaeon]